MLGIIIEFELHKRMQSAFYWMQHEYFDYADYVRWSHKIHFNVLFYM